MVDVIRNGKPLRFGLILAYAFALAFAQVGDLHGHKSETATQCQTVCDDAHPHLSGHPSPDLGRAAADCPACQLRAMVQLIDLSSPIVDRPTPVAAFTMKTVPVRVRRATSLSCRAPPLS